MLRQLMRKLYALACIEEKVFKVIPFRDNMKVDGQARDFSLCQSTSILIVLARIYETPDDVLRTILDQTSPFCKTPRLRVSGSQ